MLLNNNLGIQFFLNEERFSCKLGIVPESRTVATNSRAGSAVKKGGGDKLTL